MHVRKLKGSQCGVCHVGGPPRGRSATWNCDLELSTKELTSGYATWFTAGGAIRIAHYDVIDDVITRKV